jgi:hypothetical protein
LHHWKYGNGLKEQIYAAAKISPATGKDDKISYKQTPIYDLEGWKNYITKVTKEIIKIKRTA